jgi:hypothetical protein
MKTSRFFLAFLLSSLFAQSQVNLSSSLTACYALNGNSTEPINNLTGVIGSCITPTLDRSGNANFALQFPGTVGCVVQLPNSPLLKPNSAITVSGWFKVSSPKYMIAVFTKNTSFSFFTAYSLIVENMVNGYSFRAYRQNGNSSDVVTSTSTIQINNWYHVTFCISNNSMQLYVNGVLEDALVPTITNFNYDTSRDVILGGTNESNFDAPFEGAIDNMRFYNRILSAAEVSTLYLTDPICKEKPPTGVEFLSPSENAVNLFPQPALDKVVLSNLELGASLSVYSTSGQCMVQARVENSETMLDVSNFSEGLYTLVIEGQSQHLSKRFVKAN